jgi:hypothetical protein
MPTSPTIKLQDRFGKLTVIAFIGTTDKKRWWECLCDCGKTVQRTTAQLRKLQSCGCLRGKNVTHGMTNSSEFTIWHTMKARCYNPNATGYERYGGVGVVMCDEWRDSFEAFYRDVGPRPSVRHSIDRYPDKRGNYEPNNTRWGTWEDQNRNKRTNLIFTLNGVSKTCIEWSEILGIDASTLQARKYHGWSDERILTTPLLKSGRRKRSDGRFEAPR